MVVPLATTQLSELPLSMPLAALVSFFAFAVVTITQPFCVVIVVCLLFEVSQPAGTLPPTPAKGRTFPPGSTGATTVVTRTHDGVTRTGEDVSFG
jgi:hypothetical protein